MTIDAAWCIKMAELEEGREIGAGRLDHPLRLPVTACPVAVGDRVTVHPGPARGLSYEATVERINGDRATVRPVGFAQSQPAWAGSVRARSVRLSMLEPVR